LQNPLQPFRYLSLATLATTLTPEEPMKMLAGLLCASGVVLVVGLIGQAEPASGVTPTLLARGTFDPFHLNTSPHSLVDFKAMTTNFTDLVVRQHDYNPHSTTGWHQHPGPVFITVVSGTLTFYEADDPTCTPHIVTAGQGYVDDGEGHVGRNETDLPARDFSVILAATGVPAFRTDIAPPGNCPF
jgi:hypothetical protein